MNNAGHPRAPHYSQCRTATPPHCRTAAPPRRRAAKAPAARHLVAALLLFPAPAPAAAQERPAGGFYGGFSVGVELADTDYEKGVGLNSPPSYEADDDRETGALHSARALFGYRHWFDSFCFADAEVDAGVYSNTRVDGRLSGTGTSRATNNVFPGDWSLEKNRGASLTARFGIRADAIGMEYGTNTALYLLAGVGWLDLTMQAGFDNRPPPAGTPAVVGVSRHGADVQPWSVGIGVESGLAAGRAGLELRRTEYDFSWSGSGTGAAGDPRTDHDVDVVEWGVYLRYVRPFGL